MDGYGKSAMTQPGGNREKDRTALTELLFRAVKIEKGMRHVVSSCLQGRLCFAILPSVGYVFHKLNVDRCLLNCTNIQLFYPKNKSNRAFPTDYMQIKSKLTERTLFLICPDPVHHELSAHRDSDPATVAILSRHDLFNDITLARIHFGEGDI